MEQKRLAGDKYDRHLNITGQTSMKPSVAARKKRAAIDDFAL
jgi:hypothetical protein